MKPYIQWRWNEKFFSIISYRKAWKENGNGMKWGFRTNGAVKGKDPCLDVFLNLGYLVINYTDFNYGGKGNEKRI